MTKKYFMAETYFKEYMNMSEQEKDACLFKNSKWKDMKFTRESDWENFPNNDVVASPVFKFENGDRVVFTRCGELIEL